MPMSVPMLGIALFLVLISVSLLILVAHCLLGIAACLVLSFGVVVIIISSGLGLQPL